MAMYFNNLSYGFIEMFLSYIIRAVTCFCDAAFSIIEFIVAYAAVIFKRGRPRNAILFPRY